MDVFIVIDERIDVLLGVYNTLVHYVFEALFEVFIRLLAETCYTIFNGIFDEIPWRDLFMISAALMSSSSFHLLQSRKSL